MDFLTFLSNVIENLVWPSLTLFVLVQIRNYGPELAEFIELIRYKDFEVVLRKKEFDRAREAAQKVTKEIPSSPPAPVGAPAPLSPDPADASTLPSNLPSPELAIIEAWRKVEADLWSAYNTGNVDPLISYRKIAQELHSQGKLSGADLELYKQLNAIRNRVVHYSEKAPVTAAEIIEFQNLAAVLQNRLQTLKIKNRD